MVTEVLQNYGTNACHVFDWYAFASSIRVRFVAKLKRKRSEGSIFQPISSIPLVTQQKESHDEKPSTSPDSPVKTSPVSLQSSREKLTDDETKTRSKSIKSLPKSDSKEIFTPSGAKFPSKLK